MKLPPVEVVESMSRQEAFDAGREAVAEWVKGGHDVRSLDTLRWALYRFRDTLQRLPHDSQRALMVAFEAGWKDKTNTQLELQTVMRDGGEECETFYLRPRTPRIWPWIVLAAILLLNMAVLWIVN